MNLLFVGDSITEEFNTKKLFSEYAAYNKGVSGNNTLDVLARINSDWFENEPDHIFVMIGTNDIAQGFGDIDIINNIQEIVFSIRNYMEEANIHLLSITPTRHNHPRPNVRINMLNEKIKFLSEQISCNFIDINSALSDENDALKREFTNDGLHLNENAYKVIADILKDSIS